MLNTPSQLPGHGPTSLSSLSALPLSAQTASAPGQGPYLVDLHVNPGESVSIQLFDGNETVLRGPATITMVSHNTFPPIPLPVQVPPGHMIQQIVDENGTLRHIILSALNGNDNTSPSNATLMPLQQQQPFPYCCCCCYSCTGTAPTAPLPPPPPPPPPVPQVHHNILAFGPNPNRRRINPMNRTFFPAGKRSAPTYFNNNSIGKSPIRHKLGSPAAASVDGVSKVSFPSSKATTPSDNKTYSELNSNRVLVGKVNHNHNENNCLSDPQHVLNNTYISKESIDRKEFNPKDGSHESAPLPALPFSYTSLEEHKDLNESNDRTNCSHFDSSEKPSILLEINLSSSDSRVQNNISADIVEEDEPLELCEESNNGCKHENRLEVSENNISNNSIDPKETEPSAAVDPLLCPTLQSHEESLFTESEVKSKEDSNEESDQIVERNCNTRSDSHSTNSCISSVMPDNHPNEDKSRNESNDKSNSELSLSPSQSLSSQPMIDRSDSINQKECQSDDKPEDNVFFETNYSNEKSSENQIKESINCINKLSEADSEDSGLLRRASGVVGPVQVPVPPLQRSPKHLLPQLQLLNLTYTSLTANTVKLKWALSQPHSSGTGDQLYAKHYVVEMLLKGSAGSLGSPEPIGENGCSESLLVVSSGQSGPNGSSGSQASQNCRIVYQGHSNNCRISHLSPQQQYSFRVRTTSEEHLVVSNVLTITTPEQQPINNKYNKKSKRELLHQQIQQQQHQIHAQQLLLQQQQLQQQTRVNDTEESPAISSDQRCAILLLLLFSLFALIVAVLIQQLLSE